MTIAPSRTKTCASSTWLLAFAQIGKGWLAVLRWDPEGNATAGAAAVEAQNQTRIFRRAAMIEGADAERPAIAEGAGRNPAFEGKAGIPHQRPVAKDPKIVHIRCHQSHRRLRDPNIILNFS